MIVKGLVDEYSLQINITLVQSEQNLADKLTRVPKRWIDIMKQGSNPPQLTCAVFTDQLTPEQIHIIHRKRINTLMETTFLEFTRKPSKSYT